jgi:hypothetical protein
MASTINASTTAGLVNTADTSGILQLQTAGTTAVTVNASQNVSVGTTTSNATFTSKASANTYAGGCLALLDSAGSNTSYITSITSALYFSNNGSTNHMVLDASGNLIVGNSSSSGAKFEAYQSANSSVAYINSTNASQTNSVMFVSASRNTTANTFYYLDCYNAGSSTYRLRIADSGNVTNTNNSYGAISDAKLKENIVDASPKLADLMQVKVRNYNLIGDTNKQLGVVAQELETVFPAMVEQASDTERVTTTDENGKEVITDVPTGTYTKSVKYSVFVPMLIKAIQEQQAIITQLQADVATLKGTP